MVSHDRGRRGKLTMRYPERPLSIVSDATLSPYAVATRRKLSKVPRSIRVIADGVKRRPATLIKGKRGRL